MTQINHKPCPHPDCDSSDAFSYNTEKMVGKCHSCDNHYPMKGVKYDEEWKEEYPLTKTLTVVKPDPPSHPAKPTDRVVTSAYRADRGLTKSTMEFFGVKTGIDKDGEGVTHTYNYPTGSKTRVLPKEGFYVGGGFKPDQLFGMDKFNKGSAKALTITEGELDAMSVYQMMGDYPVVSLPSATPSNKLYERCKGYLASFPKLILSIDNDGKSDHIAAKLAAMFPNKVYQVPHDIHKDANEFLMNGAADKFKSAWWNAKKFTPENVFNTTEDFLNIYSEQDDSKYISTGIAAFDDICLGLMQGHFTIFQAPEGIGKTEFMRMLEYNILSKHKDVPIAICHMEESKKRSLLGLVSYHLNDNLTRQELVVEKDKDKQVREAITSLTKDEKLFQFTLGVDDDPLDLLDQIRYFATACDCKYIFFEPIQDLGYSRYGDETLESFLSSLSTKLARLATELNVGIISIAHENDDGQIRDCRMIGKRASVVVQLKRDKMNEDEERKNLTDLLVTKNRPASMTGHAGTLKFNPDTFVLEEYHPQL